MTRLHVTFLILLLLTSNTPIIESQSTEVTESTDQPLYDSTDSYDFTTDNNSLPAVDPDEAKICEDATCVRKCCPEGRFLSHDFWCLELPLNQSSVQFEIAFQFKDGRPTEPDKPVHFLYGDDFETCISVHLLDENRKAILLSDGQLYTGSEDTIRNANQYCIDLTRQDDGNFSILYNVCSMEKQDTPRYLFRFYSHPTCLVLSCICLLVLIACHLALPKLRDLSGLCLLSHVSSLFVNHVGLLTSALSAKIPKNICIALGIINYASSIAVIMWLTVMCFDIWRYVRMSVKGIPSYLLQQQERWLFGLYCAVVWGSITVITCIACILQFLPPDALPDYVIRPHFGVNRCFIFAGETNVLAYFYSILAILFILDLACVGKTIHYLYQGGAKICCFQKTSTSSSDSAVFNNKHLDVFWQRFQIFTITVLVWMAEMFAWRVPPRELWDLTDLLNKLQGVILLIIFLLSERKRELIRTKIRSLMGKAQTAARNLVSEDETSMSTLESNLSRLNSDEETVDRIRKLSRQEETVSSTIMKSLAQSKIMANSNETEETC